MSEWTDLTCNSPETAFAVKTYLDNEMFEGDEEPPLVESYVEKSTVRIEYKRYAINERREIDMQLLGYRDGFDARAVPSEADKKLLTDIWHYFDDTGDGAPDGSSLARRNLNFAEPLRQLIERLKS